MKSTYSTRCEEFCETISESLISSPKSSNSIPRSQHIIVNKQNSEKELTSEKFFH